MNSVEGIAGSSVVEVGLSCAFEGLDPGPDFMGRVGLALGSGARG